MTQKSFPPLGGGTLCRLEKDVFFAGDDKISIPRNDLPQTKQELQIELHGFSNASLRSYGACVYLMPVSKSDFPSVHLVA